MIEQQGRVTAVEGDRARVRVGGRSGCAACDAGRGCGAGIFGRLLNRRPAEVRVVNRLGLRPGAPVRIGLSERAFLGLVMRLYGWPLLAGLGSAILAWAAISAPMGSVAWQSDLAVAAAGFLGGALALRVARRSLRRAFTRLSPVMLDAADLDCRPTHRHH